MGVALSLLLFINGSADVAAWITSTHRRKFVQRFLTSANGDDKTQSRLFFHQYLLLGFIRLLAAASGDASAQRFAILSYVYELIMLRREQLHNTTIAENNFVPTLLGGLMIVLLARESVRG